MRDLPVAARVYVTAVCVTGAAVAAFNIPHSLSHPGLFFVLLVCSSVASALKVSLPLATHGSTMSVSYAVDFASLLLLGANETMLVAATSAWAQCTFRVKSDTRSVHRVLFSMASLVITVRVAGAIYSLFGGAAPGQSLQLLTLPKPLVGA